MKVALISDYKGLTDEGTRKTAHYYYEGLLKQHDVIHLNVRDIFSSAYWSKLRSFNPEIIHILPGPTVKTFFYMKILKIVAPKAKTVISALHPDLHPIFEGIVKYLKPDLMLVQSQATQQVFESLGCKTKFLLGGVDLQKFIPAENKLALRAKYSIPSDRPVILHVGSLNRLRNMEIFGLLATRLDVKPLVIGNVSISADSYIVDFLKDSKCIVIRDYIQNIEEIYATADCYVFPVKDKRGAIDLPLSVMEAMACNLPVVTTRFGALPYLFKPGGGFYYADTSDEFVEAVEQAISNKNLVKTREAVAPYSWPIIVKQLVEIYMGVLESD
jgi:glycosyltransferase involved in cell wall biosynthesis